jgi:hypothetical protein
MCCAIYFLPLATAGRNMAPGDGTHMRHIEDEGVREHRRESFLGVLYRYFFFQWLFFDMTRAKGPIERRAVWLHNQSQREWLPVYMRRWATLSSIGFALRTISERALAAPEIAACWYTGGCIGVSVLVIVAEVWILLGQNQPP